MRNFAVHPKSAQPVIHSGHVMHVDHRLSCRQTPQLKLSVAKLYLGTKGWYRYPFFAVHSYGLHIKSLFSVNFLNMMQEGEYALPFLL